MRDLLTLFITWKCNHNIMENKYSSISSQKKFSATLGFHDIMILGGDFNVQIKGKACYSY